MAFASLHGGLLVRKGQALPSMPEPASTFASALDRWSAPRRDALSQDAARPVAAPAPVLKVVAPAPVTEQATKPLYHRVELRLTGDQARRLGVAAARLAQPKRRIMSRALDVYLAVLGEGPLKGCGCFNGKGAEACCSGAES